MVLAAFALMCVVAGGEDIETRELRLLVETSADLRTYSMDAQFVFSVSSRDVVVMFFFPGADAPDELRSVTLDGLPVPANAVIRARHPRFGNAGFALSLPEGLDPGSHTLHVRGGDVSTPPRGLSLWGSWHPILLGGDARVPVELEVRTRRDVTVLASGHHLSEHENGTTRISRWRSVHPQGWGGLFLTVGRYRTLVPDSAKPGLDIHWPESLASFDHLAVREPSSILAYFSRIFGMGVPAAPPFRLVVFQDSIVRNFSMDGLVAISTASYSIVARNPEYLRAVLAHELAHYWWGDQVIAVGPGHRWMTEGFAEYSRYLYELDRGVESLPWSYRNLIVLSRFGGPAAPPPMATLPADSVPDELNYQKGAFVLHMLAAEIGKETVIGAMRDLVGLAARRPVSVEDFQRAVETRTGVSLNWFFEQWLHRATGPLVAFDSVRSDSLAEGWRISGVIRQGAPAYRFNAVLEIAPGESTPVRRAIRVEGPATRFSFTLGKPPTRITLDPDQEVFKWFAPASVPVSFTDIWRVLQNGGRFTLVTGADVRAEDRGSLAAFLEARFPRTAGDGQRANVSVVFVAGDSARRLRERHRRALSAPPDGTLQAFTMTEPGERARLIVGLEGSWPGNQWPELVPQASLAFIRYRDQAVVSAMPPALPIITWSPGR